LNAFLQGKGKQGLEDTSRFLINTTFGLCGLFDPATPLGLKAHNEDFGQTMAVWGVGKGPYLVLPLIGPNTVRNIPDLGVSVVTNILFYVTNPVAVPFAVLGLVDRRSRFDQAIQFRDETAVEPYLFTREAYLQRRNFLIHDGNPPIEDDDLFLDESFAELKLGEESSEPVKPEEEPFIRDQPIPSQTKSAPDFSEPSSLTVSAQ
jgi:phospholipid-binding lipoprotein MlaA